MTDYTQKSERDRLREYVSREYAVQSSYVEDVLDACDTLERDYQRANSRIDKLEKALRLTMNAMGMHGPCSHNDCSECEQAYVYARNVLEGKQP